MEEIDLLDDILIQARSINLQTLSEVITLAVEIAREGREGRRIGTLFVISDEETVLASSRPLILDPLWYHPSSEKHIRDPNLRETVKELAQLDGAFVVADDGTILSACRYIDASSQGISLPLGLGSRHMAAASISKNTNCIAVVVSESSMVRVFDNGELISEIIPEIWLLKTCSLHIKGIYSTRTGSQLTVASKQN
jgi:DNA integrity scanning protein DisA with diadenylate cyclase activity